MPTAEMLLPFLLRSTVLLVAGYLFVLAGLKIFRATSPRVHRFGWTVVLLLGWLGSGISIDVPWGDESGNVILNETRRSEKFPLIDGIGEKEIDESVLIGEISRSARNDGPSSANSSNANCDLWSQSPREAAKTQAEYDASTVIAVLWFGGVAFFTVRILFSYIMFHFRLYAAKPASDDWFRAWRGVLDEKNLRPIPMLVVESGGPALVRRLFGYVLVVPAEYWQNLSPEARLPVLRHEREHFLRRDALKSFFVRILALPQWFNPLAWSAVRRFDEAAEWACDEAACNPSETTATDAVADFAEALVALYESRHESTHRLLSGFAGRRPSMRIRRLLQFHQRQIVKDSLMKKTLILILFGLIFSAGLFRFNLVAQTAKNEKKAQETSQPLVKTSPTAPMIFKSEKTGDAVHVSGPFELTAPSVTVYPVAADPFASVSQTKNDAQPPKQEAWGVPQTVKRKVMVEFVDKNGERGIEEQEIEETVYVRADPRVSKPREAKTYWSYTQTGNAEAKPSPEVGKFRVPINYKLKNITPQSLTEFLKEQFKEAVEVSEPAEGQTVGAEMLTITASLDDHKLIKRLVTEIQREVEAIRADAAETEPASQIKVFTLLHAEAQQTAESIKPLVSKDVKLSVDPRTNTVLASGSPTTIAVVEALLLNLDRQQKNPPTLPSGMVFPGTVPDRVTLPQNLPTFSTPAVAVPIATPKTPDLSYPLAHISVNDAMQRLRQYCTDNDKKGVVIFPGTKSWEKVLNVNAPTKELVEEIKIFLRTVDVPGPQPMPEVKPKPVENSEEEKTDEEKIKSRNLERQQRTTTFDKPLG